MKCFLSIFFFIIFISSCSTDDSTPKDKSQLVGKWKLIEQLIDPGDGSGTFQPIDSNRVIEFFSDNTVKMNGILCFMSTEIGTEESGVYMMITDSNTDTQNNGEIIPNTCSSRSARVYFDLPENGNLILWYQCIEPCGQKFEKID